TAAEEVERRDLLGQQQRVALGNQHDAGSELDRLCRSRGAGEGHERIDEMRVALGDDAVGRAREAARRAYRNERMLGAPERFETELLGLSGHEGDGEVISGEAE